MGSKPAWGNLCLGWRRVCVVLMGTAFLGNARFLSISLKAVQARGWDGGVGKLLWGLSGDQSVSHTLGSQPTRVAFLELGVGWGQEREGTEPAEKMFL